MYFKCCLSEVPKSGTGQFPSLNKNNGSRISHLFLSFWGYNYPVLSAKCCNLPKGLDTSRSFFPQRLVRHWDMLPREVVTAPSLSEFGQHSGTWWNSWSCPVQGQELNSVILTGPFQFRIYYDSKFTSRKSPAKHRYKCRS